MQTGACGLTAAAASGCAAGGAPRPAASTDSPQDSPRPPRSLHPWSLGAVAADVFLTRPRPAKNCAWRVVCDREREREREEEGERIV